MKSRFSLAVCIFLPFYLSCSYTQSQEVSTKGKAAVQESTDTLYFNEDWGLTQPQYALYYRPKPQKEHKGYRVQDFYITGQLQMSGWSASLDKDCIHGEANWYYKNGQLKEKALFKNGLREGLSQRYDSLGHLLSEGIYKANKPFEGFFCEQHPYQTFLYEFKAGDIIHKTISDNTRQNLVMVDFNRVNNSEGYHYEVKYYNSAGDFVGIGSMNEKGEQRNGVFASYHTNPMALSSVEYYSNGNIDSTYLFYTNEAVKTIEKTSNGNSVNRFYYPDGKFLGTLILKDGYPYSGCSVEFDRSWKKKPVDHPLAYRYYKDGISNGKYAVYYLNGQLKEEGTYKDGYQNGEVLFYKSNGEALCKGVYKNHKKWEGSFIIDISICDIQTYHQGQLNETFLYYPDGSLKQYEKKDSVCIGYNTDGDEISKLIYKEGAPYEGELRDYLRGGQLYSISHYKDGSVESKDYYGNEGNIEQRNIYTPETSQMLHYYYGGELKYLEDTKTKQTTYYAKDGSVLGIYDESNRKRNGLRYTFLGNRISEIKKYINGEVVYNKLFRGNGKPLLEVDYYGKCLLYNRWGDVVAEGTYKDGMPYDGTICEIRTNSSKNIITMKSGIKHGPIKIYNWIPGLGKFILSEEGNFTDNERNGLFTTYLNGDTLKSVAFVNGEMHGEALFYGSYGKFLSKGTYKNDVPFEGIFYEYNEGISLLAQSHSYHEGRPNGDWIYYDDNGNISQTIHWDMGEKRSQSMWINNKEYVLKFKNSIPWEGTEPERNKVKYFFNGNYIKDQVFRTEQLVQLVSETNYNRMNGRSNVTEYYDNGNIYTKTAYRGTAKDGEITHYDRQGKLISKGSYQEDIPLAGQFVFPHKRNSTDYILLEIVNQKATAMIVRDGAKSTFVELTEEAPRGSTKWEQTIMSLLNMLNKDYEFDID